MEPEKVHNSVLPPGSYLQANSLIHISAASENVYVTKTIRLTRKKERFCAEALPLLQFNRSDNLQQRSL
jgi:hypothetical protein